MTIRIGSNISSLHVQRNLNKASDSLSTALTRLSSGMRINSAVDDAAGLSIASSLNLDARVTSKATQNLSDGVSMLNIAQGALEQLSAVATRQMELAEQAANGTYTLEQRKAMQTEAAALSDEWGRIVQSTSFNGISLLDPKTGAIRFQAGYGVDGSIVADTTENLARDVGTGTFNVTQTFTAGGNVGAAAIADFDSDGIVDLIVGREGWRKGNGDGTFGAATALPQTAGQNYYFTQDLNNDGIADLITTSTTHVNISMGNGNGTFRALQTIALGAALLQVTFADFNGDGSLDMVVPEYAGGAGTTVPIFMNNGNGTFGAASTTLTVDAGPFQTASGDFNGDGRADLAITSRVTNTVSVRYGNGAGGFTTPTSFALSGLSNNSGIRSADFNLDGYDDLVVTGSNGIRVVMANSDGTFKAATTIRGTSTGFSSSPITGDINGDGFEDIVVADSTANSLFTFLGNGDGTFKFKLGAASPLGNAIQLPAMGDFNNDGVQDVLASTNAGLNVMVTLSETEETSTIARLNLLSQDKARDSLSVARSNLERVSAELGNIGVAQSRFSVASAVLQRSYENIRAAESRIMDVDVAEETANMVSAQIRQQASAAIAQQANLTPQLALLLLRG